MAGDPKLIYEPEQFPGPILHFEDPCKVSLVLFASGKVIMAGLKSLNKSKPVAKKLAKILHSNE